MQLLVDVGNSRIKWAFFDGRDLHQPQVANHQNVNFDRFLHHIWRDLDTPSKVWITNVAGDEIGEALTSWIRTIWHQHPIFLQSQSHAFGVINGYQHPQALGHDRWLGLIAAFNAFDRQYPVCVIDCGTCLTIDVVDAQGYHLGGLLLPGIHTMRQALSLYTDGCQFSSHISANVSSKSLLAKNTQEGMIGGTLFAAVAYVERFIAEIHEEFSDDLKILISGGEAPILMKLVAKDLIFKPHIVLEGMAQYAKDVQKQKQRSELQEEEALLEV